jgi:putative tricarboxylic transport membrane protein
MLASTGLILAGLFFAVLSARLPTGRDGVLIGPGIAPFIAGMVMLLCGAGIAFRAFVESSHPPATASGDAPESDPVVARKTILAVLLLAGCAVLFEPLGFMLSTFLFLAIGFAWLGDASLRAASAAAAVAAISLWLIFTKLLGVGLPYGLIGEILFR